MLNDMVHLGCTDQTQATVHLVIVLPRIRKSGTGDDNFLKWEGTLMTRPVKEDHLQSWSRIFWSDQIEMVHSIT